MLEAKQHKAIVGANLQRARGLAKMSRRQLSDLSGLSEQAIQKIEHGHNSCTMYTAYKLVVALDTTVENILPSPLQIQRAINL